MQTVSVSAAALRRAIAFTSDDATRRSLQGVLLEPSGAIVATNGAALYAERNAIPEDARPSRDCIVIVPPALLKGARLDRVTFTVPTDAVADGDVEIQAEGFTAHGSSLGKAFATEREGPYPRWRQVVPVGQRPDAPIAQIDAVQAARFVMFGKKEKNTITLTAGPSDSAAILVTFSKLPDAFGLLMPCPSSAGFAPARSLPFWALPAAATKTSVSA